MSFQYPLVDPHQTTYDSNVGVHVIVMSDVGTPT